MAGRFYIILIFLLMEALLPLRSEKARLLSEEKKITDSGRLIHKLLANIVMVLHVTKPSKWCSDETRGLIGCISQT